MPVYVIDTLKPKNGLDFPVVEAVDVAVEGYLNLADAVTHFATDTAIVAINATLNTKANTSDVNSAVSNLQGQIDQIVISASAESIVAPEVAAARVDETGVTHDTLKARIDFEFTDVKDGIDIINSEIYTDEDVSTSTISNAVISSNDTFTSASGFGVARFAIEKGKIYKISRTNATGMRIAFSDSETPSFGETMHDVINAGNDYILKNQTDYKYCFVNEYSTTAPSGSVAVVLASSNIADITGNVSEINDKLSDVKSDIDIINSEIYTDEDVSTSTISNAVISTNDTFTAASGFGVARFAIEKGKIYKISRTNATGMRIAFSDSETPSFGETMHDVINAGNDYILKNQTDYKYCFVNEYSTTAPSGSVAVVLASSITNDVSEIDDKLSDISEDITDEVLIRVAARTKISGCYMDATTGQIKEYSQPVTSYIFYIPCKHNIKYKITKYSTQLFRIGTFSGVPAVGSEPVQYYNLGTGTECYINTTNEENYIAVHYYSSVVDGSAPESSLYYSIAPYYTRTYEDYSSLSAIDVVARHGLDEVKSLVASDARNHINEFETQGVTEGMYVNTDGTLITDNHSVTTNYVDVHSGDILYFSKRASIFSEDIITDTWQYAFYNENKELLIREHFSDLEKIVIAPEGASFIRASAKVDTIPALYNINSPKKELPYINIPCSEVDENETDIFVDEAIAYSTSNSVNNDAIEEYETQYPDLDLDTDNFIAHGALIKSGTSIVDGDGNAVWLRGVGLHNLLVYSNLHSYESLLCLKYYGVNTIRLSAYPARITESGKYTNLGYIEAANAMRAHMCRIIDRCIELGIYVIVDWHCMRGSKYIQKNNFVLHEEEGLEFFDFFSKKYADNANVIYEFTNEPGRVDVAQLVEFIKKARTTVLSNCNYTPIMVTGVIDSESVGTAIETVYNELEDNGITDVFLSPHRYRDNPTDTYDSCISQGIPIFVTEWGLTGATDPVAADILAWHKENNVACINWKFTDQSNDIWAMLENKAGLGNEYYGRGFKASDLTDCGNLFLSVYQSTIIGE